MRTALRPLHTIVLGPAPRPPRRFIPRICSRRHSWHIHSKSCSHSHHDHDNNSSSTTTPLPSPSQTRYAPSSEAVASTRNYLSNLLRTHDHASYILTPFIPPSARDAYLAIKSFNLDTALVADQTSNVAVGRLRMKFWRDAIEAVFKGDGRDAVRYKEPTIVLLANVLVGGSAGGQVPRLNKGWFLRNIAARESLLTLSPFPSLAALETYSENTYSSLYYLLLESLHIHSTTLDHIAGHLGKATGITAILRGVPLTAFPPPPPISPAPSPFTQPNQGAVLLPLDILSSHSLSQESLLRLGPTAPNLKDVIFEIATRANDHLLTARRMIKDAQEKGELSKGGKGDWGLFLGALPTRNFLGRLEEADFDVFDARLARRDWRLVFQAYWAYRKGKF
ncbi:Squalene/phytoene synthase-domain-containing protein [Tirmania nivea]|nr:Squalene/phytoene synthase-domain-containing protein [Tirmania nivea]